MNKKVYFAGSIRGGRADAYLYRSIITYIQKTDIVLTEHVGDLSISLLENGRSRDAAIWAQDTEWLKESDLVIAECTNPSLGVGYELAFAEAYGIPCYCFYDPDKVQLSAMITGDAYFTILPYHKEEEIYPLLDRILAADPAEQP